MTQELLDQVVKNVNILLKSNKLNEALIIMENEIGNISSDLGNSLIGISGDLRDLKQRQADGLITDSNAKVEQAQIRARMLTLMELVPSELETQRIVANYTTLYTTTSQENLEKIQGQENNLVPMSWIYKAKEVSKSVCQVIREDGIKGSGWLLEDGWMMTNFHVIPNANWVGRSKIELNFAEDLKGKNIKTSEYELDPEGAIFSPILKLDYALIKVKDKADDPLSYWGAIEIDSFSVPQKDDRVAIIQHPKGGDKQIALTGNKVVSLDGNKLFYLTDTEKGSSGSPVLNHEWKVVALHHAGKTEDDGGLVVNAATGERMGANEGILIKPILEDIKKQRNN